MFFINRSKDRSNFTGLILFLFLSLSIIFIFAGTASADTISIQTNNSTIQAAIDSAHDGDTIDLAAGTYNEYDITVDKNVKIEGPKVTGKTTPTAVIDAQGQGRVFYIPTGVNVTLEYLTIQNGDATNGGGISNDGQLNLQNCTVQSNTATGVGGGGGVSNGGIMTIDDSDINNNIATDGNGGGIYNYGSMTVSDSNIHKNTAYGYGGGIENDPGTLNIDNSYIDTNYATGSGGGVDNYGLGTIIIDDSSIYSNHVETNGGGIDNNDQNGLVAIDNSKIYDNNATNDNYGDGGGIYNEASMTITNTDIDGNIGEYGGGIYAAGHISVDNSNIDNNTAIHFGGAISNDEESGDSFSLTNSNIYNNKAPCGGGIDSYWGAMNVYNSNIYLNIASLNGGGIYNENYGVLNITDSNIYGNTVINGIGSDVFNNYESILNFNRIAGTETLIACEGGSVDANNNWWGSNDSPSGEVSGNVDVSTWLVLNTTASPTGISPNGNSTITADLTHDQNGDYYDPSLGHVPDGIPVSFTGTLGTINPLNSSTVNGVATSIFNAGNLPGVAVINSNIDGYLKSTNLIIISVEMYVMQYPWYYDTVNGYENTYSYNTYPIFVVDVENWGNDDATGVTVNYTLGTGLQYITSNTGGMGTAIYNPTTRTITWNIGDVPTTGTALMMVDTQAIATGDQTPALTNTATLTHVDQYDVPNNYKTANYSINVPKNADIQVNQTQFTIIRGSNKYVNYTINAANNGPDNATGLQITDTLPTGLTWISDNSGGTYNPTTGTWNIGTLNNGNNIILSITALINGTGTIINTAQTTAEDQQDWNSNNNAQTLDLTITGKYTPNTNMYVLQYPWYYDTALGYVNTYSYNTYPVFVVDVENWGNDDATGVTVNYTLGTGLQYITSNTGGIGTTTYNPTTRTITWNIGNMPTTGTALMMIDTQTITTGNQTTALTNTATLTHVDQNDTPNNYKTAQYAINVPNNADIQVNQTVNNTNPQPGNYVTITTTNNGPDNATGITITDLLPTGLTVDTDPNTNTTTTQGTYNTTTGQWNIGNLNNGANATLTIIARDTATNGTTLTNTAATNTLTQDDWNTENNTNQTYITTT